ncbi:DUF4342 domain-containing protein [Peptoniphilus sp.]|uniref:DUF4342 domain-containing protein n=1 Tax=Peptoniphilus sp. TaxID=1971214 RepID=UPI003D9367B4
MISMEKIDYVINVTGASYEIVRKALLDSDGDVDVAIEMIKGNQKDSSDTVEAEVIIEDEEDKKKDSKDYFEEFTAYMEEIIDAVKEIWRKGNARRLLVEKDDETVLSLSLTTSAIGIALALPASLLGLSAAYVYDYSFKIIMEDGEVIDIKEYLKDKNKFFK